MVHKLLVFCLTIASFLIGSSLSAEVRVTKNPMQSPKAAKSSKILTDLVSDPNLSLLKSGNETEGPLKENDWGWGDEEEMITVTCNFEYEKPKFMASAAYAFGGDGIYRRYSGTPSDDFSSATIEMPIGTYDFYVEFTPMLEDAPWLESDGIEPFMIPDPYKAKKIIIYEDVVVSEETTLTFNIEESTKGFVFFPLNNENKQFSVPVLTMVDGQINWNYSQANVDDVFYLNIFWNNEANDYICGYGSDYAHQLEDGRTGQTGGNFFLNDVSDKYTIYQLVIAGDQETQSAWALNMATSAVNEFIKAVMNARNGYTAVSQDFISTPATGQFILESPFSLMCNPGLDGVDVTGFQFMYDQSPNIYCQNYTYGPIAGDFVAQTSLQPQECAISYFDADWYQWVTYGVKGCPIISDRFGLDYDNQINPFYSASVGTVDWVMGEGNPVTFVTGSNYAVPSFGGTMNPTPEMGWTLNVFGHYGDELTIDTGLLEFEGSVDGEVGCTDLGKINEWSKAIAKDGHTPGEVMLSFTNYNIRIEDKEAVNLTEVSYNENNKDVCPPTLQQIRFRDKESGQYGSVFDKENVVMELSAGDINSVIFYPTSYAEAEVKVEYAPNNSDEWKELTVEKIVDLDGSYLPVYSVDLSQMDPEILSQDGWFDLLFTITDEAGNKMVQKMTPAIRIKSLATSNGIDSIKSTDTPTEYYDLLGRRLEKATSTGIVLERQGTKITKRVIR